MRFTNTRIQLILLILCFWLLQGSFTQAATVKIAGSAPGYVNNVITLNRLHDFISEEAIRLGDIRFNAAGEFSLQFELAETCLCYADFDGYHGMVYLEPGKSYKLILPPKRPLTESQMRNPFVKPDPVWFGISMPGQNELNYQIQQFEQKYAVYENKYFDQIFINRSKSLVDTVKNLLDKEFKTTNQSLFESHKLYRKANLEYALHQGKVTSFMEAYFSNEAPVYNLAAYASLFNQVFSDYFSMLVNTTNHTEIKSLIQTNSLQKLDEYFQKNLHFNRELAHWVLLKSMMDAYYNKQFSKSSILKMLDQVSNPGWSPFEKETAAIIRSKLVYLTAGTNPPTLTLKDLKNQRVNLTDFRNSYIYLHFTDPKNTICQQHLNELKKIAAHYPEKLMIINVIPTDNSFNNNNSNWPGIFTTTTDNLKETYKVKTFPISFLIGKDGRLLLSPAPNPIDGLDRQLGQIFKSDYFRELQKANQKN